MVILRVSESKLADGAESWLHSAAAPPRFPNLSPLWATQVSGSSEGQQGAHGAIVDLEHKKACF